MTLESTQELDCPRCGHSQEVTIWRSVNVTLDPSLRALLEERRINAFRCDACGFAAYLGVPLLYHDMQRRFCVQFHPAEAIADDDFIARFEPAVPTSMKSFPDVPLEYLAQPHLVFDMDDLLHCVEFFERLLPVAGGDVGPGDARTL